MGKNQPDRSYYKSLYKFDPRTELLEYSLPFYDNHASLNKSAIAYGRPKLPPLARQSKIKEESVHGSEEYVDKASLINILREANHLWNQLIFQNPK